MFRIFNKKVSVYSPIKGRFKKQEEINDPVFSTGAMGVTFAVDPADSKVYAPIDGVIDAVFPTKHALSIVKDDIEMILHVGIDTVSLKGEGFSVFVKEGDVIKKGDLLMEVDFNFIADKGYQKDVIVAISNAKKTVLNTVDSVDNTVVVGQCG